MTGIPTEDQFPYDNLDRLVRVKMRPKGMAQYYLISDYIYWAARGDSPISYDIARSLDPRQPKRVGIFTGASSPEHYPNGENDGPLGTIVLAGALRELGHQVSLFIDPQLEPIIGALMDYYGHQYTVVKLGIDTPEENASAAAGLQVAVAVEKAGTNPSGKLHSITGFTREGTRAKVDAIFQTVESEGGVTISCCDGVNEIGFGKVYDAVADAAPWTTECRCGCGKGIMCSTPVTHLYATSISNWGAYALAGALALYTRDPSLLHTSKAERDIEQIAVEYDVRDGSLGKAGLTTDGVPLKGTLGMIEMMRILVELSLKEYTRNF